jgi:hypothetical protein
MKAPSRLAAAIGRAFNALGVPCFVRKGAYESAAFGARVRVRCGELFTVVSVNEIDVYFDRFSGRIDGVGLRNGVHYRSGSTPGPGRAGG